MLTIDDEPEIRSLLADELREDGFEVIHAGNGADALEIVRESPPQVIIVDLLMPKMTGIEFLNRLHITQADPYAAIVVSGLLEPVIIEACMNAGASTVIDKPFRLAELRRAVRELASLKV